MKCPLCDCETDDLTAHLSSNEHEDIEFVCELCQVQVRPFSALIHHCHSDEHLYRTGKLQKEMKRLTQETTALKQKLAEQTKKTIKAEQDKIEILQAGYARK